jgi:uncharacterized protein involved in outer membrane biogenesis
VRRISRRTLLISGIALAVLVIVVVTVLPIVVRRVAVDKLTQLTGRAVTLVDVDLNLFTGRLVLHRFRLAQKGSDAPAVEIEQLAVQVAPTSLVTSNIRVREIALTAPRIYVARLGPDRFDFDDLLALIPPPDPSKPPPKSTTAVIVEKLSLARGLVVARDEVVHPAATWKIDQLTVDGAGISTRAGAQPGRLSMKATVNGHPLSVQADPVEVSRSGVEARLTFGAFDVMSALPYVPDTVAMVPASGTLDLDLRVKTIKPPDSPLRVSIAGDVGLSNLAVARRGESTPFVRVPTLKVAIKEARPLEGLITLAAVEVDGLDLKGVRDKQGQIDLLALAKPPASSAATPSPAGSKAAGAKAATKPAATAPATTSPGPSTPVSPTTPEAAPTTFKLAADRIALTHGLVTLRDEDVSPVTTLPVKDITVTVTNFTWPDAAPLGLDVSLALPTAGKVTVKGTARLTPLSVDVTSSLRGGAIEPYYPYIPFKGRLAGRFNGDSRTQVAIDPQGKVTAASKGTSWIENLEVRNPNDNSVPLKLERFELAGIDFAWPKYARVATITIKKPNGRIERDANGAIRLKELLAVSEPSEKEETAKPAAAPAKPAPVPSDVKTAGGAVGFPLDIGAFVIDDGYVQFLDRTVQPAFSETISRLAVRIEGLSSTPGKRAKLASQAIVGGNAALDIKGELAPLGEIYADITGELRDFRLASVNPYADSFIAWIVDRGKLGVRFHYRVERGQLEASNEIFVDDIHVAPTRQDDEVKKKVGLPLGLIVALITDANNDLKINLPMSGPLDKWKADLSDAIWAVVKNVVVNVVAAPFRAIGRLFKGNDDKIESLGVDPVVFTPGAETLAPGMDEHLVKVADFMRRAPAIKLTLTPIIVPADVDNLKGQELTARLQARQREAKLPDFAAAVAAEYRARFLPSAANVPGSTAPAPGSTPPATSRPPATPPANAPPPLPSPEEQLAKLREVEPVPEEKVTELRTRRLAIVRDGLVKDQGIPEGRLTPAAETAPAAPATPATGDGRVEFQIGQ